MTTDPKNDESTFDRLMEQEARLFLEARMLPNQGPLTPEQRADVRQACAAYLKKHGISQTHCANQIGLRGSTLNVILHGTYHLGPLDEHLRALNDWMEIDARRRQMKPTTKFVETLVAKRILAIASNASQLRTMALCHGPAGVGKSMVAHVLAERFPGAIYISLSTGETTYVFLRKMIAMRLRIHTRRARAVDQHLSKTPNERIFERLRDSHRLIIVDEAHRLADSGLEFLRDLYDNCHIPILLLCTKDLMDRIRKDADPDHGQLISRFGLVCELTKDRDKVPGGTKPLFTPSEIRALFDSSSVRLHTDAEHYLSDVANNLGDGSLRSAFLLYDQAVKAQRKLLDVGPAARIAIELKLLLRIEQSNHSDTAMLNDIQDRARPAKKDAMVG